VQFLTPIDHQDVEEAVRAPEDWERAGGLRPVEAGAAAGMRTAAPFAIEDANYAI
jgi:hypothetical protein